MAGDSGFLSSGDENHGEALELHKWCQALLSNFEREFGIALKVLQGKMASSRVEGEISWFFSSCLGTLEVPLNLRLGRQKTSRVALGKSSLLLSCEGKHRIALESLHCNGAISRIEGGKSHGVSRVVGGIFGFLSPCDSEPQGLLILHQGSQASFQVARGTSGFLSKHSKGIGTHFKLSRETPGFS